MTDYEIQALLLSLKIAGTSVLISLPLGVLCAFILARFNFFGKSIFDGLVHLPLVLPPVVIGYILLISMGKRGFVGEWLFATFGISISFSWQGAVLAVAVISFPLLVRSIRLGIENVDQKLEETALTLGASPLKVFFTITLPLTIPSILTGMILAFARALGEFGATITFVSNIPGQTQTIPLAMYAFIQTPGAEASAMRLCIISVIVALSSIILSEWLSKKARLRLGNIC